MISLISYRLITSNLIIDFPRSPVSSSFRVSYLSEKPAPVPSFWPYFPILFSCNCNSPVIFKPLPASVFDENLFIVLGKTLSNSFQIGWEIGEKQTSNTFWGWDVWFEVENLEKKEFWDMWSEKSISNQSGRKKIKKFQKKISHTQRRREIRKTKKIWKFVLEIAVSESLLHKFPRQAQWSSSYSSDIHFFEQPSWIYKKSRSFQ